MVKIRGFSLPRLLGFSLTAPSCAPMILCSRLCCRGYESPARNSERSCQKSIDTPGVAFSCVPLLSCAKLSRMTRRAFRRTFGPSPRLEFHLCAVLFFPCRSPPPFLSPNLHFTWIVVFLIPRIEKLARLFSGFRKGKDHFSLSGERTLFSFPASVSPRHFTIQTPPPTEEAKMLSPVFRLHRQAIPPAILPALVLNFSVTGIASAS